MPKLLPSDTPFEQYRVYGPYLGIKGSSERRMVTLVSPERTTTMAYARYLLCVREGRWLSPEEEADHQDNNPLNDDLDNLQILTPAANKEKSRRPKTTVDLICPECGTPFTRERRQTHLVKGGEPSTCSRRCGGIRSHRTKNSRLYSTG